MLYLVNIRLHRPDPKPSYRHKVGGDCKGALQITFQDRPGSRKNCTAQYRHHES